MPPTAPSGPVRACIACGKADTDPKHGIAVNPETIVFHHVECGPLLDPPCGTPDVDMHTCARQLVGWNGERGEGLRTHIMDTAAAEQATTEKENA